jgi:hypothetical protein
MKGAGTDALRIVEEWEPYNGGKHSIRALHDLDILDKHRLIVPQVFFVATVASIPAQPAKLLAAEFLIIAGVSWTTQTILLLKYVKVRTGHPRAWLAY